MSTFSNMKIFLFKAPKGSFLGNGSVTVCDTLEVKFTVVKGKNGIFGSLPAKKSEKDDKWWPDVKFLDQDVANEFQNLVKMEYNKSTGQGPKKSTTKKAPLTEEQEETYTDDIPF